MLSSLATAAAQALEGRHAIRRTRQLADALADALAEQHELLQVTLRAIGDAVITTDAQAAVVWMNPVAEALTGWLSGQARERPLEAVFSVIAIAERQPLVQPKQKCCRAPKSAMQRPTAFWFRATARRSASTVRCRRSFTRTVPRWAW